MFAKDAEAHPVAADLALAPLAFSYNGEYSPLYENRTITTSANFSLR